MQMTLLRTSMIDHTTTSTVSHVRSAVGAYVLVYLIRTMLVMQELGGASSVSRWTPYKSEEVCTKTREDIQRPNAKHHDQLYPLAT